MCWKCDNPEATVEEFVGGLRDTIRSHGWAVQFIEGDRPFAYTIGLHERALPELMLTGLQAQTSARLLNSIAHQIADVGMVLKPGEYIDFQDEFLLEVVEVEHPDVHLKYAAGLYGTDIRAFQLVWTDDRRHWPWDSEWGHGRPMQPVLGVRGSVKH